MFVIADELLRHAVANLAGSADLGPRSLLENLPDGLIVAFLALAAEAPHSSFH